ncbi:MAG: RDD family protein [Bacteroidales bacterium]|nr:RDD family protein [Bacteroidales bacterium]
MNTTQEEQKNKDVPNQDVLPVFIKYENVDEAKDKIDYSKAFVLPSIKTRYFSTLIDICVIFLIALGISQLFEAIALVSGFVRGTLFVVVFILYEPILVSLGSTVGQYFLGLRVRRFNNPEKKVLFPILIIRVLVKYILGWLSFITVTFNTNRRAIHDFVSGSIVIAQRIDK